MYDFTEEAELVRPAVSADEALAFVARTYDLQGDAKELGSNQDRNYRIATDSGRYLCKIDNAVFGDDEIAVQLAALAAAAEAGLTAPVAIAGSDGNLVHDIANKAGTWRARVLTYVEGEPFAQRRAIGTHTARVLGRAAASVTTAFAHLDGDGFARRLQWDMRSALDVVHRLAPAIDDDDLRKAVVAAAEEAAARITAVANDLPVQVIHGDLTPDNVVDRAPFDGADTVGFIDFGDVAYGWRAAEPAVAASGILSRSEGDAAPAIELIAAYGSRAPLNDAEITAMWPLVVLRGAVLVASGFHQVALEADNAYAAERMQEELLIFNTARALPYALAQATIAALLGCEAPEAPAVASQMIEHAARLRVIDPSPESPLVARGAWLKGVETTQHEAQRIAALGGIPLHPYGAPHLTRTNPLSAAAPENVPLHTAVELQPGETLHAPTEAIVLAASDAHIVLSIASTTLDITGATPTVQEGTALHPGDPFATAAGTVTLTWHRELDLTPPAYAAEPWASGWRHLTLDPAPLFGLKPHHNRTAHAEAERKREVFAEAQEHYYAEPPLMVRGWRTTMIDATGRSYLDMVNNVTGIGHAHPRLTDAVAVQLDTLNTNSRFLYPQLTDLSERLLATAPDASFDTVLLVNSGSEAVELALVLARAYTGRQDVIALREGYHGWTVATDAITTSAYDNPHALENRPAWVHLADVPNPYRGTYRGPDSARAYVADLEAQIADLVAGGTPPGAYIGEPILGNAGGVTPPTGYVAGAYAAIRAAGGVAIADEVQVGYGRTGATFWACEAQGAVPDIITIAKAMGNAYPVGAVLTRAEIAASLSAQGHFFSSAGGSPASCAAAIAVLDVMRDEDLQRNAAIVGDHLQVGFRSLADRHALIGATHGAGLYLGLELVRDHETLEPADIETAALCERLRELGVIMQATSERQNVLKIKPPLTLTIDEADFFLTQLDRALGELA